MNNLLISTKIHNGIYNEYSMTEKLYKATDGTFFIEREFFGYYDEMNCVRNKWVHEHNKETISEEEAMKWIENKSVFHSNKNYCKEISDKKSDSLWYKPMVERNSRNMRLITVSVAKCVYCHHNRTWEDLSDLFVRDLIEAEGMSVESACEAIQKAIDKIESEEFASFNPKTAAYEKDTVVNIIAVSVYDKEEEELETVEHNNLYDIYISMGEGLEGYDIMR